MDCSLRGSLLPHGLSSTRLLCPWNSPGKNTGVGCHPTQGSNLGLLHCRRSLYCLSHQGNSLLQEPQETQDLTILPWRTGSMKNSLINDTNPQLRPHLHLNHIHFCACCPLQGYLYSFCLRLYSLWSGPTNMPEDTSSTFLPLVAHLPNLAKHTLKYFRESSQALGFYPF